MSNNSGNDVESETETPSLNSSGGSLNCSSIMEGIFEDSFSFLSHGSQEFENLYKENPGELILTINQVYQTKVEELRDSYQERLENVRKYIKLYEETGICSRDLIPMRAILFTSPYFKNNFGSSPRPNMDSITKKKNKETDAYTQSSKVWQLKEKKRLIIGVRTVSRKTRQDPHIYRKEFLVNKLRKTKVPKEKEALNAQLRITNQDMEKIKNMTCSEVVEPIGTKLDWLTIANTHMKGQRSPEECELMWNNFLHPAINKKPWTPQEDSRILALARQTHGREWEFIASQLQTNRTAVHCLQRYHQHLSRINFMGPWQPDEDQLLYDVVKSYNKYNSVPWHLVSYYMEGRSSMQIKNRWYETLNPNRVMGKWSPKEDMTLMAAVKKFGEQEWNKVASYIPGRSNSQCRDRYRNSLLLERGRSWTKEEDLKLMRMVKMHKGEKKWAAFAKHFEGRTDNQLLQRYKRIIKSNPSLKMATLEDLPDNPEDLTTASTRQSTLRAQSVFIKAIWDQMEENIKDMDLQNMAQEALPSPLDRLLVIRSRMLTRDYQVKWHSSEVTGDDGAVESQDSEATVTKDLHQLFEQWHLRHLNRKPTFISRSQQMNTIYHLIKKEVTEALWATPLAKLEDHLSTEEAQVQRTLHEAMAPIKKAPYPPMLPPCPASAKALNMLTHLVPSLLRKQGFSPILEEIPRTLPSRLQGCTRCQPLERWQLDQPTASGCAQCGHLLEVRRHYYLLAMRILALFAAPAFFLEMTIKLPQPPNFFRSRRNKRDCEDSSSPRVTFKRRRPQDFTGSAYVGTIRSQPSSLLEMEEDEKTLVFKKPIYTYSRKPDVKTPP